VKFIPGKLFKADTFSIRGIIADQKFKFFKGCFDHRRGQNNQFSNTQKLVPKVLEKFSSLKAFCQYSPQPSPIKFFKNGKNICIHVSL